MFYYKISLYDPVAIGKKHKEIMPQLNKLVMDKIYFCELLNDATAYANVHVNSLDSSNNVTHRFR